MSDKLAYYLVQDITVNEDTSYVLNASAFHFLLWELSFLLGEGGACLWGDQNFLRVTEVEKVNSRWFISHGMNFPQPLSSTQ